MAKARTWAPKQFFWGVGWGEFEKDGFIFPSDSESLKT